MKKVTMPGARPPGGMGAMDFKRPGEMDEKSMMERFAAMGRGKPGAPTQNAVGAMGQRRPRSAAMIGRMARQGMPAPGTAVGGTAPGLGGTGSAVGQRGPGGMMPIPRGGRQAPMAPVPGMRPPAVMPSRAGPGPGAARPAVRPRVRGGRGL